MAAQPLVTVVMPCHNAAGTLHEALGSLQGQTLAHWRLVAVDDGSTDATPALLEAAARQDPRVRVLRPGRVGLVAALQAGCAGIDTPYIARMDADDVAHPERLDRQLGLMEARTDVALSGTGVAMFGGAVGSGRRRYERWINGLVRHEDLHRERYVECPVPHPTFMLRREAFEAAGGYEDRGWPEDYDLFLRLVQGGGRVEKLADVLLRWREHGGRTSMTDPRYSPEAFRALKRHYLARGFLADAVGFVQWGAGEVGKRWLREWGSMGPAAVVDINPRKVGTKIHGYPVIAPEALASPGATRMVVAVGAPGARRDIRAWCAPRGYEEGRDFVFIA